MIKITTFAKYCNRVLNKLNLPTIDLLKLRQQSIYYKILNLVPTSIQELKSIDNWNSPEKLNEKSPIFFMWWTGLHTMPPIVELCYKNLYNNAKSHPIIVITQQNYHQVLPVSIIEQTEKIVNLYNNKRICIQHLSDLIRTLILSQVGGIWIDATVFVTPNWDKDLLGSTFYSGRRTTLYANSGKSITQGQWTSYFIASVKGNPLINFIHNGLKECYERKSEIKEYYTMDYLFSIALKKSLIIKNLISTMPRIDANLFELETLMHKPYKEKEYATFIKTAPFFKLNHRTKYQSQDSNGNITVFGYLSQNIIKFQPAKITTRKIN